MMKMVAAVAAVVGITVITGTNASLALGLGLIALASSIVVTEIMTRLEQIEHGVEDLRHQREAEQLDTELVRRQILGAHATEPPRTVDRSA